MEYRSRDSFAAGCLFLSAEDADGLPEVMALSHTPLAVSITMKFAAIHRGHGIYLRPRAVAKRFGEARSVSSAVLFSAEVALSVPQAHL